LHTLLQRESGQLKGEILGIWVGEPPPANFTFLGIIEPTPKELGRITSGFSGWELVQGDIERRWGLEKKERAEQSQEPQEPKAKLSLKQFRALAWFDEWKEFRSPKIVKASQKIACDTVDALIALGPRPPKEATLKIIRQCVEGFNELDGKKQFIDSIER